MERRTQTYVYGSLPQLADARSASFWERVPDWPHQNPQAMKVLQGANAVYAPSRRISPTRRCFQTRSRR